MTEVAPLRIDEPHQVIEIAAAWAIVKISGPLAVVSITGASVIVDFPNGSSNMNGGLAPDAIRNLQECNAELLAALKDLVADMTGSAELKSYISESDETILKARAAIAKSEGA